jgi:hypothetical protein
MIKRITVTLEPYEYSALLDVALCELRNPADQIRHMVRRELQQRGLIDAPDLGSDVRADSQARVEGRASND